MMRRYLLKINISEPFNWRLYIYITWRHVISYDVTYVCFTEMPRKPSTKAGSYQCPSCPRISTTSRGLTQHSISAHKESYEILLLNRHCITVLRHMISCDVTWYVFQSARSRIWAGFDRAASTCCRVRRWATTTVQRIEVEPKANRRAVTHFVMSYDVMWCHYIFCFIHIYTLWCHMTSCDVIIFVFSPLPGNTFSDALAASYVMATDSSKWDITMFLNMCKDTRF